MRRGSVKVLALSALCTCLLTGCGQTDRGETASIFAMDTVMDVTAYGPKAQEAVDAAVAELNRLDRLLSAQRKNGRDMNDFDIGKVNARSAVSVSPETATLIQKALALCEATDGALDITIYPAMEAWGFPTKEYRVPDEAELAQLQTQVNYQAVEVYDNGITRDDGMKLDLGAVGKGYAADRVAALWADMGVTSGLLDLGHNIHCIGAKPDGSDWSVGIRDPEDENGTLCTVSGRDMAVVTSGAYERNFTQDGVTYHHILDPRTCAPADSDAASVTVIGPSGFTCDALSTALYVMGLRGAADYWREHPDFDMVYYTQDGELWYTSGLTGRIEPREGMEGRMLS